jgi:FkbM family methyltransferase
MVLGTMGILASAQFCRSMGDTLMVATRQIEEANMRAIKLATESPCTDISQVLERRRSHPFRGFIDLRPSINQKKPICLFCNNDDLSSLQIFWCKNFLYEPNSLRVWAALSKRSGTIIDIGAHVGIFTMTAALANPGAKVYAFEAVDYIYARLMVNVLANGLPRIEAHSVAISDKVDWKEMNVRFGPGILSSGSSIETRTGQPHNSMRKWVRTETLDSMFGDETIDLIKIDVEGHEAAVLSGGRKLLGESRPIIMCEILREDPLRDHTFGIFENAGFNSFAIEENRIGIRAFERGEHPPKGLLNYLFVPSEKVEAVHDAIAAPV